MTTSGILNVNKPAGMTSHDVVDRVRRILRQRRVGHAGALDPLAKGVLLICVGQATRLAEYLMATNKVYRARLRLGITTETHDAQGKVVDKRPVEVKEEEVRRALAAFLGPIEQVPPMYSALKHEGTPLYKLARRGIEVERKPRRVEIRDISLEEWSPPWLTLRLICSPGTYIRALARDLGEQLGCGAHVASLTRLACGDFTLEEAVTLEELAQAVAEGRLDEVMYPPDAAVASWPSLTLDEDAAWRITHGQQVVGAATGEGEWARVYSPQGEFLAIAERDRQTGRWQPRKVFNLTR